jgi:DNA-binding MarR family transcriptional regulator
MTSTTPALVAEAIEQLVTTLVRQPRMPGDAEPGDLSTFQATMLATLVDQGRQRLGALATTLGTTDATTSRNVDTLERLRLATRTPDTRDRRGIFVSPTEAGIQTVKARRQRLEDIVTRLAERLGPTDGARLATLLTELSELLRET